MLKGYNGKILRVNLTSGVISFDQIDEKIARKYIGGTGIAAKINKNAMIRTAFFILLYLYLIYQLMAIW